MMPCFAALSTNEKVFGTAWEAPLTSLLSSNLRIALNWCRSLDLRMRLTAVFLSVIRTRFRDDTVLAIYERRPTSESYSSRITEGGFRAQISIGNLSA